MKCLCSYFLLLILFLPYSAASALTAKELASQFIRPDWSYQEKVEFTEFVRNHIPLLVEIASDYKNCDPWWAWRRPHAIYYLEKFSRDGSYSRESFFDLTSELLNGIKTHRASEGKAEEHRNYIAALCGYSFERYHKRPLVSLSENFGNFIFLVNALEKHDLIANKLVADNFRSKIETAQKVAIREKSKGKAVLLVREVVDQTKTLESTTISPDAQRVLLWYGENLILHIQVVFSGKP
jgi:hypothetical protein